MWPTCFVSTRSPRPCVTAPVGTDVRLASTREFLSPPSYCVQPSLFVSLVGAFSSPHYAAQAPPRVERASEKGNGGTEKTEAKLIDKMMDKKEMK